MSSDTTERRTQRLDRNLAALGRYAKHRPKKLPPNVMLFPHQPILDRAPMPMNFAFLNLNQIRNGLPTVMFVWEGREHVWTATKEQCAVLQQRHPGLRVHALGEHVLVVDNATPKPGRKRRRLPRHCR